MHCTTRAVGGTASLVIPMFLCATVLSFGQNKTERERKPTEQVSPAPNAATQNIPAPAKKEDTVFKGLKYRPIGPYRGGRSLTASGIPGDPNTYYFGSTGGGVWKSTDGGKTWKNVGLLDTRAIGKLIVHPRNPDIVYVAALGHPFGPNAERGIFRTMDGRKTWEKVLHKDET